MVTIPDNLRRFYIVTNVVAVAVASLAAIVNASIGPINFALWVLPVAIVVSSALTLIAVDAVVNQSNKPDVMPLMVRRLFGKRVAYFLRCTNVVNTRIVSRVFLVTEPVFFIVIAVVLLIASFRGQITAGS
jgi:hypothetical protein